MNRKNCKYFSQCGDDIQCRTCDGYIEAEKISGFQIYKAPELDKKERRKK